jgi:hypothetical protein
MKAELGQLLLAVRAIALRIEMCGRLEQKLKQKNLIWFGRPFEARSSKQNWWKADSQEWLSYEILKSAAMV